MYFSTRRYWNGRQNNKRCTSGNRWNAPDKFYYDIENDKRINRSPSKYQEYKKMVEEGRFYLLYGAGNLKFIWQSIEN